jgi:hypothetical protein
MVNYCTFGNGMDWEGWDLFCALYEWYGSMSNGLFSDSS